MNKHIFITGVAGFLGSHLAEKMLADGYRVSGCDNLIGGYKDNVPTGVSFFEADARDFGKMKELLKGVDVLYHCAAAPHEGFSVFAPVIISNHTYDSTVSVVTAAVVNNVSRVIFCSSMSRYGHQKTNGGIFTEDMSPMPVDPYAVAKYASEVFVQVMSEAHGFEYVILVPHNIYGSRQKYDDPYRNVVSIMINRMLRDQQPIIYGDGQQRRSFSHIADVVEPFVKTAELSSVVGQVINIGPDEEFTTINELAKIIAETISFDLHPIYMPDRPQEVKHAGCSAQKARDLLGYKTTTTLRDGVRELVEWIRLRGPKPFEYHLDLEIISDKTPRTWKDRLI